MNPPGRDELDARLDALATRIDDALSRAQPRVVARATGRDGVVEQLHAQLDRAPADVNLQALRCQALEDHIVELEAALVGARDHRARAEALAESARREADAALDELERLRSNSARASEASDLNVELSLGEALQTKLLEIERLTRERDALRTTCDELRGRNRELRRERDESTLALERLHSQVEELRVRDGASRSKLAELERVVDEQRRELELAERRAKHMRAHMGAR